MACNHNCSSCSDSSCKDRDFTIKPKDGTVIKKIIAVTSGKGGVGKSLVTSLLAVEARNQGLKVGIMDADVTGPSIPKSFGLTENDRAQGSEEGLFPVLTKSGIKIMSMNLLLEEPSQPVVWRGPVISGVVKQFFTDVLWGELDVLFIDMPPGTGDVPLTVFQSLKLDGIVVVTTPQDLVSLIVEKSVKMAEIMNSGDAAIAMIAKKVPAKVAAGTFGIMKLDENNQILEFAEKPKTIPEGYADNDDMCLTNTFQFSVSKEAFEALDVLKDEFKALDGKESRDWSKFFVPVLMSLSQSKDEVEAREKLVQSLGQGCENIDLGLIAEAKDILGNQKIYAVPTDESWADVGSMGEMYKTMIDIAKDNFKLEPFERNNVLDSINTQTGLVATTKEDKEKTEAKYDIEGQVMVVPKAEKVDPSILDKYIADGLVTINPKVTK